MKTLAFCLFLITPLIAISSVDLRLPWYAAKIEFEHGEVEVKTSDAGISSLIVTIDGVKMIVPPDEFKGIQSPRIESINILGGAYYGGINDNASYTIVEIEYGRFLNGEFSRAKFAFHSGRYQQLVTISRTSEKTWETFRKLPGEKIVPNGNITTIENIQNAK